MITPTQAADIINYLLASQAVTVVDNQATVWADYINDPEVGCPQHRPADTAEAVRLAIHEWSSQGRHGRMDVARIVAAMRKVRSRRLDAVGNHVDSPSGLDGRQERQWIRAFRQSIADGRSLDEAKAEADNSVGVHRLLTAVEPDDAA